MSLLPTREVEKVWGCTSLPAPFAAQGRAIGEIWFEPPVALPQLLAKYIFTSQALSVQVHPSDHQTLAAGLGRQGKEECWLVASAEPGARLVIGFKAPISAEAMRAAALDGSIEDLLVWHEVVAGDFFYIPANTVHAIGAGVCVIEVQQNSDITYRLYDYGRPRELHLEEGMAVALGEVYDRAAHYRHVPERGNVELVRGPHFRLWRVDGAQEAAGAPDWRAALGDGPVLVLPQAGQWQVDGAAVPAGACALALEAGAIGLETDALGLVAQPVMQ